MKTNQTKTSFIVLLTAFISVTVFGQISVSVNSGDPSFPFPQFSSYTHSKDTYENLGTILPPGISHAEMEQEIKDAYQLMMSSAFAEGTKLNGVEYIQFVTNIESSEIYGYGLLAAAYMADKKTFDGLWLYLHDKTQLGSSTYSQCLTNNTPQSLPNWDLNTTTPSGSSAEADADIALALYIAYKQWGEFMGINDDCDNPISYKDELFSILKAMSDTTINPANGSILTGDIGIDGYLKSGNTFGEVTTWGNTQPNIPFYSGPTSLQLDYLAPSYYRVFSRLLEDTDSYNYKFNIDQFSKAAASSDWLIGQIFTKGSTTLPLIEIADINNESVVFSNGIGMGFKTPWRNALSCLWQGTPQNTWNASTHQITTSTNSYQKNMAIRYANFLKQPQNTPWSNECLQLPSGNSYQGSGTVRSEYDINGKEQTTISSHWIYGASSSSAVVAKDHNLMAEIYRQCALDKGVMNNISAIYDGWFRLLGLLTLTGNFQSPEVINPSENLHIYQSIDKTVLYPGETATYTFSYRNYGSVDAEEVEIIFTLPQGLEAQNSTSNYTVEGNTVRWKIGTVPGFSSINGAVLSTGLETLTVKAIQTQQSTALSYVSIQSKDGGVSQAPAVPNNITPTYEHSCPELLFHKLTINKTASEEIITHGEEVTFTINYSAEHKEALRGGRPEVQFSFGSEGNAENANLHHMKFKIFHDADEPYIDYSNYRFSFFYFNSNPAQDFDYSTIMKEGLSGQDLTVSNKVITSDSTYQGKWNRKVIFQLPEQLAAPFSYVDEHSFTDRIAFGTKELINTSVIVKTTDLQNRNWSKDWSFQSLLTTTVNSNLFPISPNYTTDFSYEVKNWGSNFCSPNIDNITNILVEEFDGYAWRKVAGNSPEHIKPRETSITIRDTIPDGLTFVSFVGNSPAGTTPTISGNVIEWKISSTTANVTHSLNYRAIATNTTNEDIEATSTAVIEHPLWGKESTANTITIKKFDTNSIVIEPEIKHESESNKYDGAIGITVTGGAEPYTYTWSHKNWDNTKNTKDIDELTAGEYTLTVIDSKKQEISETFVIKSLVVIQPKILPNITPESGPNKADGAISIVVIDGISPYTYAWDNGETTSTISALPGGTYSVTVTDDNSNSVSGSFEVLTLKVEDLVTSFNVNHETYTDAKNGTVSLTVTGGQSPYTYLWSNDSTKNNLTGLKGGLYSVTITDNIGNQKTDQIDIKTLADKKLEVEAKVTSESYTDAKDGAATLEITGGVEPYTILWEDGNTEASISGLTEGSYPFTVKDESGMEVTGIAHINTTKIIEELSVYIEHDDETYTKVKDGAIYLTVSGGQRPYTYTWSNGDTTPTITDLSGGTYSVTIIDASETQQIDTSVTISTTNIILPLEVTAEIKDEEYTNANNGSISLIISGGKEPFTIEWGDGSTGITRENLTAGSYTVTITDNLETSVQKTITIKSEIIIEELSLSSEVTDELETNSQDGAINLILSGGKKPFTFNWSNTATTQNISSLTAGEYTVTVTDSVGNQATHKATVNTITEIPPLSVSELITDASPEGEDGSITLTVSGGKAPYTYKWSNEETTPTINNLSAGIYSVTITDAIESLLTKEYTVKTKSSVSPLTIQPQVTPELYEGKGDGKISLTITGGTAPYSFIWSNEETTQNISNLNSGAYTVTVSDAKDNTKEQTFSVGISHVFEPLEITDIEKSNESGTGVKDGAINITVEGGAPPYSFQWSNQSTSEDLSNLSAGEYTVTITDIYSQEITASYTINTNTQYFSIEGSVVSVDKPIISGEVLIFESVGSTVTPVANAPIQSNGTFKYEMLQKGDYILYAMPDHFLYPELIPTYFGDETEWQNAFVVKVTNRVFDIEILLHNKAENTVGLGTITAEVSAPADFEKDFYENLFANNQTALDGKTINTAVYLYNSGVPVAWGQTNANGEVQFDYVPNGEYEIIFELAGHNQVRKTVIIAEDNNIQNVQVVFDTSTSVNDKEGIGLSLFPNPASDFITIKTEQLPINVSITNLTGYVLIEEENPVNSINISNLPSGTYIAKVYTHNGVYSQSFIVR